MMLTPPNNNPGAEAVSGKPYAGIIGNEGGFVLAFSLFMLAVCMILGSAAMNTSVNEIDISSNEVIVKQTYVLANSGYPLAAIPVLTTAGVGSWDTGTIAEPNKVFLSDTNPLNHQTAGATIEIVHGQFLYEGREEDEEFNTGWNNSDKYLHAPNSTYQASFLPIDDPFQEKKKDGTYVSAVTIDDRPDIRIRYEQLVINIDVDKASVGYGPGGVAEFSSGADQSGGANYKIIYLMDCKATVIGKDIGDSKSPVTEVLLGYRYIPGAGI